MPKERPSPEKLLQRIQQEERTSQHGRLKIFLGAAPGVGKTHSMLENALAQRAQGLDVIIGVVESHGRKEIEEFVKQFEVLPRLKITYHNQELTEFDLDAALIRAPAIILIDEMAHTNVPGLRHNKRWQDIKEILDSGIDVYTTLNVQHIESLNDVVSQIIHTRIKETVPDFMLELADTIELIDLPPEDLLKRLQEGKVYIPAQAEIAIEHFFRRGNLSALREIALRVTAERVGEQVLLYRQGQGIQYIWPTNEKLLVCVGSSVNSNKLIRAARRMATSLQVPWLAIHVESSQNVLSDEQRTMATQNLRLAEQLGAETSIVTGRDLVKEIINYARDQNVTKIIVGKHKRSALQKIFTRSLTDALIRASGEIDIYIITVEEPFAQSKSIFQQIGQQPWAIFGISIAIVALTTLINLLISPFLHSSTIMIYLFAITLISLFGYTVPAIFSAILSVIAYDYFFITHHDFESYFTLIIMLAVSLTISHLTVISRRQIRSANWLEKRTSTLHTLSKQLAASRGLDKLLEVTVRYLAEIFDSDVLILLPEDNQLIVHAAYGSTVMLNEKEQSVAEWVFNKGQIAGLGTDTLPYSDALYIPLLSGETIIGVIRAKPCKAKTLYTSEQIHLLETSSHQIALAIDVEQLHEQSKKSELQTETERVRSALIEAVAQDLQDPLLSAIKKSQNLIALSRKTSETFINTEAIEIYKELEQLNSHINNLLQIAYLETDFLTLDKRPLNLRNIVESALAFLNTKIGSRHIILEIPTDLPKLSIDKALTEKIFINLLDNAIKFSTDNAMIVIKAERLENKILVSVADEGSGIAPDEVNKIFDKFYQGRAIRSKKGMGLGLAICKSVVTAHGGDIWAENRPQGGAIIYFTLPIGNE